jgi:aminoglycoside phosphotransferase (APT) family kinase protein
VSNEPGPLIASGRDADIFDVGHGRVLRRSREGKDVTREAELMRWLHGQGFPVPEVYDATPTDLIMERIDGPTLIDGASRKPWTIASIGRTLGDLHQRLHALTAPPFVDRRVGDGTTLLHLDLHPLNVLVGPKGPVIIDWTNARVGDPAYDVAYAWLVMAIADVDSGPLERAITLVGRRAFLRGFLSRVDRDAAAVAMAELVDRGLVRLEHFNPAERARIAALPAKVAPRP